MYKVGHCQIHLQVAPSTLTMECLSSMLEYSSMLLGLNPKEPYHGDLMIGISFGRTGQAVGRY
jgi:hypothetical protein